VSKKYIYSPQVETHQRRKRAEEIRREDTDWIYLAQDRDQCRVLMDTVMKLRFSKTWRIY